MSMASTHNSGFLGTGWAFPPQFGAGGAEVAMVSGVDDIEQSLGILLSTRRLEEAAAALRFGKDPTAGEPADFDEGYVNTNLRAAEIAALQGNVVLARAHSQRESPGTTRGGKWRRSHVQNAEINALRKLDALDTKAFRLRQEIADLPGDLARWQKALADAQARVLAGHQDQNRSHQEIQKLALETKTNLDTMTKYQVQQNTVKSNEEYSQLKKQIEALKK